MTPAWTTPELTALERLPMHSVTHADRLPLDGRWRFQLLSSPEDSPGPDWGEADVLITDAGLDPDARATLAGAVRSLVVVESEPSKSSPEVARAN